MPRINPFLRQSSPEEEYTLRKYHHVGIPTDEPREGERHNEELKFFSTDFSESPYGIEWMRFEPGCLVPDLVKRVAHVAFEVDDLEAELQGHEVLIPPNSPSEGVVVAFIVEDGTPVEFLQYL
jgi:hypothetical protein